MNILFISNDSFSNNTSSVIQNKGIVQGLHQLGHVVDVLTLQPEKNMNIYDESMNDMSPYIHHTYYIPLTKLYKKLAGKQKKFIENTGQESALKSKLKGKIRRLIKSFLVYDIRILNVTNLRKIHINLNKYEIVISASDPKSSHYLGYKLLKANNYQGRYIQYWGDPLYLDITRQHTFLDPIYKYEEKKMIGYADKVMYATPFTLKEQQTLFSVYSKKMSYVNQVPPYMQKKENTESKKFRKLEIVYCGDYRSKTRNILPLYNAISYSHKDWHLTICGTSDLNLENNRNVTVRGQISHKSAVALESSADILISICNLHGTQIPGKIYYLCNYDIPILILLDGDFKVELEKYFKQFEQFNICENNESSIIQAIEKMKFIKRNRNKLLLPEYMAEKIIGDLDE